MGGKNNILAPGTETLDRLAQTIRMTAPIKIVDTPLERQIDIVRTKTATAAGSQTEPAHVLCTWSDTRNPPHAQLSAHRSRQHQSVAADDRSLE